MKGIKKKAESNFIEPIDVFNNGVHYSLSDGKYIDQGWTILPDHKILRKEKIYYAWPTKKTKNDWLARNEILSRVFYKRGSILAQFDENSIKVFYKCGNPAIDIKVYHLKDTIFKRLIVYEDGIEAPLAVFDTLGRGIVYDNIANIRFKYNQLDAEFFDSAVGTPRRWKWVDIIEPKVYEHIINDTIIDPPDEEIDQLVKQGQANVKGKKDKSGANEKVKTPMKGKSLTAVRSDNSEVKKSINHEANTPEKVTGHSTKIFKMTQIKPFLMKLNDFFTLVIFNQRNVSLRFRYDRKIMKIELGVILTRKFIETQLMGLEEGATIYEEVPSKSKSIAEIQENIQELKMNVMRQLKYEKLKNEHFLKMV